jgi:shikimate dehydrogenase
MTDQYAVFGHPVEHSWSPFIHGMFAKQTGQDIAYRKVDVPPEDFIRSVAEFFKDGGKGLNITVPHKVAALSAATEITARAERAGAANTLAWSQHGQCILADNTDGFGLVQDLRDNIGLDLRDQRVLVCGAGGATRGVLAPLLAQEPSELIIANRNVTRAQELAGTFGDLGPVRGCGYDDLADAPTCDLIINATSAALRGEAPPLPASLVHGDTVCYDMSYGKGSTPFTVWASGTAAQQIYKGWGMLVEQAAESFRLWRGVRPDTAPVLAVLAAQES